MKTKSAYYAKRLKAIGEAAYKIPFSYPSFIEKRCNLLATIFCFTSTGNSLFAAKKLSVETGGNIKPMLNRPVQCDDDVIGFVFPVYFWGLPRMVARFVSELQITNKNAYIYGVITSGGPGFGELGRLKKLLQPKGVRLQYGARIISVSNYLPFYTPKDSKELREKINHDIMGISGAVNSRRKNRIQPYTLINKIVYALYPGESSDRYFTVSPACTGCGCCATICPAKNITVNGAKLEFLHQCEHCLACVHHCPAHAIDWKQKTQGKARFKNRGISLEELVSFNHMPPL